MCRGSGCVCSFPPNTEGEVRFSLHPCSLSRFVLFKVVKSWSAVPMHHFAIAVSPNRITILSNCLSIIYKPCV